MRKVTVRVPATSANLGPGFDSVGCAWNLYNTFRFEIIENGLIIDGCDKEFQTADNLCIVAYKTVMDKLNLPMDNLHLTIISNIPVSRGLGSSSTLITAGAFAANALHGNALSKDDLLCICNQIEGHPDNITPAILGGLTASFQQDGIPYTVKYNMSEDLHYVALIPDFPLSTSKARSVLPKTIDFSDATYNLSRISVLLKSFESGNIKLIRKSLSDKLHQPYRFPLIKDFDKIEKAVKKNENSAICISGAGSTLLVITDDFSFEEKISKMLEKLETNWQVVPLTVNQKGIEFID